MKYSELGAFSKHLQASYASGRLLPVYLILGKDALQQKEAVSLTTSTLLQGHYTLEKLDGETIELPYLRETLAHYSLLSKKRVVHLFNAHNLKADSLHFLSTYLISPNPSIYLVISALELHKNSKLYKHAEREGVILEYAEEKPWEKERALSEEIALKMHALKKKMPPSVTSLFLAKVGHERGIVFSELEKLTTYIGEREGVTEQDIDAIVVEAAKPTLWSLAEAILQRQKARALTTLEKLLNDGIEPIALIRFLRKEMQTKAQVLSIHSAWGAEKVTEQFPYMKGKILEHNVKQTENYGQEAFFKAFVQLTEGEARLKSSSLDKSAALGHLIIHLMS